MYSYGKSLGIPDRTRPATVFMDNDLERLAQWYHEKTGWNIENVRKHWQDYGDAGTIGRDYIVVAAFPPGKQDWRPGELEFVMAHELVHQGIQAGSVGRLTAPETFGAFSGNYLVATPRWLLEGMADVLPTFSPPELGRHFSNRRSGALRFTEHTDLTLRDAEVWPSGFLGRIGHEDKKAEAYEIIDCIYQCGYLAVELLASYVGLSRLHDYFMHLEPWMVPQGVREEDLPRPGWRLAFEKAYGMTIDEFYELFEEHRTAGFPELEIPEVVGR